MAVLTYQDLQLVGDSATERADFARNVISEWKSTEVYRTAVIAEQYDKCRNTTTMQYQRMITDIYGKQHVDTTATVHRSTSNFFNVFCTQLNQYLLGNGVSWKNGNGERLGGDFDTRLQEIGKDALVGGIAFGFWNLDHVEVFRATEFAPLYDEETGALAAGVRWWQISSDKPLRAVLYELDGYTSFLWMEGSKSTPSDAWQGIGSKTYIVPKTAYRLNGVRTAAFGVEILNGENYPSFPIVPLWGNPKKQSELVGLREKIDAYDFILNGWEDDLDNAQIYWIIKGAGGMDDTDLTEFMDRLRNVRAAAPGDGQEVSSVTVEIPYAAREQLLDRLERQLYKDAMILNPSDIVAGASTATQIRAAYEPQNVKADQFEYCVIDFIDGILAVAGIDDEPSFTRSQIINTQEEITTLVAAAAYLDEEYVTRKILSILGDGDQADEVLRRIDANDAERLDFGTGGTESNGTVVTGFAPAGDVTDNA